VRRAGDLRREEGRIMRERAETLGNGTMDSSARITLAVLAALLALLLIFPWHARAQDVAGEAEYARGEVVFLGSPADVPSGLGLVTRRFHARARLTTLATKIGDEKRLVALLRSRGVPAALNRIARASFVPNDPNYGYQWHFGNIQGEQAWDVSDGTGVVVAVLDTGLRTSGASDGIGCVVSGYDFVNNDANPNDGEGHGTHVSGTVAQTTDNGIGNAGMAPGACIMPVKVLDNEGSGFFSDIADGVYWAVDNGADVINMSLGNTSGYLKNDPVMDPALDYAHANGVTVVCAAGNEYRSGWVSYPAIYPTTIAVGATDYDNALAPYSNGGEGLDIVAPGGTSQTLNGVPGGGGVLQETRYEGT